MDASSLVKAVAIAIKIRQPLMIRGEPGGGKTSLINAAIKSVGHTMVMQRCSTMDMCDARGMPMVVDHKTEWAQPAYVPTQPKHTIFYDEFPQATATVMSSLSEILCERTSNGIPLPPDTGMILAGNRRQDRAGVNEMPTHIRNRLTHVGLDSSTEAWIKWAMEPGKPLTVSIPDLADPTQMHEAIMAFIRFRSNLLSAFDANAEAFPTPRSWEFVNKWLPYLLRDESIQFEIISGCVGEAAAGEFTGYLRLVTKMPDPDAVFLTPETAPVPEHPGIMYALCVALANRVTKKTANNLFTYLARKDVSKDFSVVCAKDAVAKDVTILQCPEGLKWATKNAPFLMG